jgi:hypothetical protein
VDFAVVSHGNTAHLDHGLMKIIIDILGHFMPGFTREIVKRLPLDAHDNNDRNGLAGADAHARAEH